MRPTVVIITYNESQNIQQCLESIPAIWPVIVVDSCSSDETVELSKNSGAEVISQPWLGYGQQKQFATNAVTPRGWVLSIDADERLTPELVAEIKDLELHPEVAAWIPRQSFFLSKKVRFCGWSPDYTIRLFNSNHCNFDDRIIHEKVTGFRQAVFLNNPLLHYPYETKNDINRKIEAYGHLGKLTLRTDSHICTSRVISAGARAIWAFIRTAILKFGVLDGVTGLRISFMNARVTYRKYL